MNGDDMASVERQILPQNIAPIDRTQAATATARES
jgi:hypothetical protein